MEDTAFMLGFFCAVSAILSAFYWAYRDMIRRGESANHRALWFLAFFCFGIFAFPAFLIVRSARGNQNSNV